MFLNPAKSEQTAKQTESQIKNNQNSNSTYVVFLNESNFANFNSTTSCYFIEFFAPWCGHCKTLKPIYESSAKTAEEKGLECKFAAVDATENKNLSNDWQVKGYPSIYFVNNKLGKKIEYTESREEKAFLNFIITHTKEFKLIKKTVGAESEFSELLSQIENLQKQNYLVILANSDLHEDKINQIKSISDSLMSSFDTVYLIDIKEENKAVINKVFNNLIHSSIKNKYLFDENGFFMFSRLYDKNNQAFEEFEFLAFTESEWKDAALLKSAFNLFRFPVFSNATQDIVNYALETGINNIIILQDEIIVKKSKKTNKTETEEELKQKAELKKERLISEKKILTEDLISEIKNFILENNLRKDFLFSFSTLKDPSVNILVDVLKFEKKHLPLILLTKTKEGTEDDLDKYKLEKTLLTKEIISQFVTDFKENKMKKFLTSDDLPKNKTDDNGIYKIVGLNFDEFLQNHDKDIALFVCSKFSKICKKFAPILTNIAKIFKGNNDLLIGETDPNYNEYSVDFEAVYPSLIFLPKSSSNLSAEQRFKNSVLYNDAITTKNIKEFILQNTRFKLSTNNIGNETEIHLKETKKENIIEPIRADDSTAAESDLELENMFGEIGGDDNMLGDLLKNLGGQMGNDNIKLNEDANLDDINKLKELLGSLGGGDLGGIDLDKLKDMDDLDMEGDEDDISDEDKFDKIKSVLGDKIPDSLNPEDQEESEPMDYNEPDTSNENTDDNQNGLNEDL